MNISYLKNKNIHFVECENWHDAYGYEKSEMKEDTINYIEKLQQENRQLQKELEEYKNPIKYFKYANKNVVEENEKLKDNWNKLKIWLEEYNIANEKWYSNELSNHDREYYKKDYLDCKFFINKFIDKMQELERSDK